MNKHSIKIKRFHDNIEHFIKVLKISLFFLFFCKLFSIASGSYSQEFVYKPNSTSLKNVYNKIEKNSSDMLVFSDLEQQQKKQITGRVLDESGEPIIGANVVEESTTNGTVTDVDGQFMLNVENNAIIIISYIGYLEQKIITTGKAEFNILLAEDTKALEELIVVGYGTQKKVNLTGSVSSINSDFIENRPITNASQALQGINGIYVNQASGQPGADDATIRIRGIGTLNNNNPLVLVDGVQFSLRDINPNDIESVSVLKDAASASIYGNRAANGVILITTKKGKQESLKLDLSSYLGFQKATYLPKMVTNSIDYMIARNEASINEKQPIPYKEAQIEEYKNGTDPDLYPNTDWYDIVFSTAMIQEHYIRISGGGNKTTTSFSLGYMDQKGVLIGTSAKKYSFSSNLTYLPIKSVELGAIINGSYWDKKAPYAEISGGDDSIMGALARALPIHPNILSDGRYGTTWLTTPGHNVFRHPVARSVEGGNNIKSQRLLLNLYAQYNFPLDFRYKVNFAVDKSDINEHSFTPEIFLYTPKQPNVPQPLGKDIRNVSQKNDNNLNTSFFQTLDWIKKISEKHEINLLLGFSKESFSDSYFNAYIEGFLGNELPELNAGTINKDLSGTSTHSKLMSYFGRVNYVVSDKYLFESNFRYDGSSRFAKGNRWGFFPSFSAGWRLSEETFLKSVDFLSNLKARVSWGQLGNQNIPLYSYLNKININQQTTFNNVIVPGSAIIALSDNKISWETTTISNLGVDIGFWDNKLEITIDVFDKSTEDILARINIPGQVGNLQGPITNLYAMSNKGIEVNASYKNTFRGLNFNISSNIAYVKNNVDFLNGDIQYTTNDNGNIRIIKEGYPVNSWYLYEAIGIFQTEDEVKSHAFQHSATSVGDIKYRDVNGDNKIDIDDTRVLGRSLPKYTYGFNFDLNYKNFDLSAIFQGVYDIDIYPRNNVAWPLYNGAGITVEQLNNSWTPENPNAKFPRLSLQKRGTQINARNSSFWLKDASYLRLKNLQLGYTVPSKITNLLKINKMRFYVNGQNLLTFSKFKLSDPEKNILEQDIYDYPTIKIASFGCNITF